MQWSGNPVPGCFLDKIGGAVNGIVTGYEK